MSTAEPAREDLLAALRAVREAIGIPNGATAGDQETRDKILLERVMHATVFLDAMFDCLGRGAVRDVPQSVEYLRARLAEHPAEGYRTWAELMAELERDRKAASAR